MALISSIEPMPRKPIELPPGFARSFVDDMRACRDEFDQARRDRAHQLHALAQHYTARLRVTDVIEMFVQMKDQV